MDCFGLILGKDWHQRYGKEEQGKYHLPSNSFRHFHEDNTGIFWLATGDKGLIRWNRNSTEDNFQIFNQVKGLSTNALYSIHEDEFENLWISSDNGIIQFNKNTFEHIGYLPKNGITAEDFNRASHFKSDNGTIYFGSLDGITAFQPSSFAKKLETLPDIKLFITHFEQYDGASQQIVNKTADLLKEQKIILEPSDHFFSLTFLLDE